MKTTPVRQRPSSRPCRRTLLLWAVVAALSSSSLSVAAWQPQGGGSATVQRRSSLAPPTTTARPYAAAPCIETAVPVVLMTSPRRWTPRVALAPVVRSSSSHEPTRRGTVQETALPVVVMTSPRRRVPRVALAPVVRSTSSHNSKPTRRGTVTPLPQAPSVVLRKTTPKKRRVSSTPSDRKNNNNRARHNHIDPSQRSTGLTRPEEILYSHQLRTLRTAIRMRDQVSAGRNNSNNSQGNKPKVTEAEWAAACGTSVPNLRRWMVRGRQAREILCHANVGLVTSIAKKHYYTVKAATQAGGGVGTILTLADMIQEGNLGLMEAAERYEPERGWRFSTYAVYWIRQRISRSVADTSRVIRLPAHVHGTLSKVRKVKVEFQTMRGRDPTTEELAAALEMTTAKLAQLTASSRNVVSLENPLRAGGNTKSEADRRTIGDALASDERTPEEDALQDFMRRDVRSVLETVLEVTECAVVKLRFGLYDGKPRSVKETARLLELSGEKVRLTEARALNKLRHPQRNYRLKEYVTASSRRSTGTTSTAAATDQKVTNRTVPKKQIKVWESAWNPTEASAHGAPVTTTTQPRSDRLWFF